jgi:hypothetical protein
MLPNTKALLWLLMALAILGAVIRFWWPSVIP